MASDAVLDRKRYVGDSPPGKDVLFAAARKVGIAEAELTDEAYQESYDQWPLRQIVQRKDGVTKR